MTRTWIIHNSKSWHRRGQDGVNGKRKPANRAEYNSSIYAIYRPWWHQRNYRLCSQLAQTQQNRCCQTPVNCPVALAHLYMHQASKKTVKVVFCHNYVKFSLILIIFGTKVATTIQLCKIYSFSTSPNLCQCTTCLLYTSDAADE